MDAPALDMLSVGDIERAAVSSLPADVYDFVAGGSGAELTLAANRAAFDRCRLLPRVMADVSACTGATTLVGTAARAPMAVAPMAYQALLHPEGELALARAAREAGIPYTAATMSSVPLEEVASVGAALWFQLYWLRDRGRTADLVQRAEAAGCEALILTVDVPRMGRRLRDIRNEFVLPRTVAAANLGVSAHTEHTRAPGRSPLAEHAADAIDPALDWSAVAWLRERTRARLVLKGILHPEDARQAAELGVDGIVVSNHGGRQLDGALPAIIALPAVRDAVGDGCEVLLDSGVRGGGDVLKALALGAAGVMVGRPALWGLAVGGQAGAARVLSLLRTETEHALALSGCRDVGSACRLGVQWGERPMEVRR